MESKIDMDYLREEYFTDYNKDKTDWYTMFVNNYRTELKHQMDWREFIYKHHIHITFFEWYEMSCRQQGIDNPFLNIYESPKITQEYKDVKTNDKITAIHPPKTSITIQDKYLAIPLATINQREDLTKGIIYQNNYSSEILSTMSQQLNRIESNQNKEVIIEKTSPSNQIIKPESNPLFIP